MTEWTVVTTLVVLVGFIITVMTPLIKLNSTLTRLATLIEESEKKNKSEHKEMHNILDKHQQSIDDHEHRLTVLEQH